MLGRKIKLPVSSEDSHLEDDKDYHSAQQKSELIEIGDLELPKGIQHLRHQLEQGFPDTQVKRHSKVSIGSAQESPLASRSPPPIADIRQQTAHIPLNCR